MFLKKFALLLIVPVLSLIVLAPAAQADSFRVEPAVEQAPTEWQSGKKPASPIIKPKPTPGPRDGGGDD